MEVCDVSVVDLWSVVIVEDVLEVFLGVARCAFVIGVDLRFSFVESLQGGEFIIEQLVLECSVFVVFPACVPICDFCWLHVLPRVFPVDSFLGFCVQPFSVSGLVGPSAVPSCVSLYF